MGKRSKEKLGKKERRRAEAAAIARSAWIGQAAGLTEAEALAWSTGLTGLSPEGPRELRSPDLMAGSPGSGGEPAASHGVSPAADIPTADDRSLVAPPGLPDPGGARHSPADATELAARLAGLSTVLQRGLTRADTGDGLTRARLSALSFLVLGGPRTLGELAAAEHVRPPTMTRLVHAMETDGLVVRERHPTDGRSIVIRATAEGADSLEQGRLRQLASLAAAISELEATERQQLDQAADLLGRVLRRAGRERDPRPA